MNQRFIICFANSYLHVNKKTMEAFKFFLNTMIKDDELIAA